MKEITDYIEYVRANPKQHALKTRQSIERIALMVDRVKAGELVYNAKEVKRIFTFFEKLVTDETKKRIKLTLWQKFFLAGIFGFRDKAGSIVLNDAFLFIAKKNGKTALIAGIALYYLITVAAAQVLLVATDYSQAKIAFEMIVKYIRNTPILAESLNAGEIFIRESAPLTVIYYPGGAAIRIIPETRARQAQGFNPNFIMFDEIASYRTSEIMTKLASGQVKSNAIRASLTTAETDMQNPGRAEYDRAAQVLEGRFAAINYFPLIYELDKNDDKWDESVYCKANPSLDIIKPLRKVIEDRERARQNPIEEASFFAYQLNVWSQNAGVDIADADWMECANQADKYRAYLTDAYLATCPWYGAIDLSKNDDYTAYTKMFWIQAIKRYYAKHIFYIPAALLDIKSRIESESLRLWVSRGYVTATRGDDGDKVVNYDYLKADIIADHVKYPRMIALAYDVALAGRFITEMQADAPEIPTVSFSNTWKKISPANRLYMDAIYSKKLIDDNPVMRWMIGCVHITMDRIGNTRFEKPDYRQSPKRIDGVDTSVMSLSSLVDNIGKSVTDEELQASVAKAIDLGTQYGY